MSTELLSSEQIERFRKIGYVSLPGVIERGSAAQIMADMDEMMAHRAAGDNRLVVSYESMGLLTSRPSVVESMHHIHATRQDAGCDGVGWHQDYEQYPQTNRTHLMVHVFYYLNGLCGEVGDLLLLPGSHELIAQRDLRMLEYIDLPGSLCFDDLEPGSAVIVHSALWHARKPKPGGEQGGRYFIDISYCQHGTRWSGYGVNDEVNAKAMEMGLDRNGRYDFLYDGSCFFDPGPYHRQLESANEGSFVYGLLND